MPIKKTYDTFVNDAILKFGNDIDLSLVKKENFDYSNTIYKFRCIKHNIYRETTCKILMAKKYICQECCKDVYKSIKHVNQKVKHNSPITLNKLIEYFKNYENNGILLNIEKSDFVYIKSNYLSLKNTIICFTCNKHGEIKIKLSALNKKN